MEGNTVSNTREGPCKLLHQTMRTMHKSMWIVLSVAGLAMGCDVERMRKEREAAQHTLDSLRFELSENQRLTATMVEVGTLLDSIDANRHVVRTQLMEGVTYDAYAPRLSEINRYVKRTEEKVASLEKSLRKSRNGDQRTYTAAINKLRADLDVRNQELKALKELAEMYKSENDRLSASVSNQQAALNEKLQLLKQKQEEVNNLDAQVRQLMVKSKLDEGEAFYQRAVAVEETANRTRFAPRKKRETRKEALELYRMALFCGKLEAQAKMEALQQKL